MPDDNAAGYEETFGNDKLSAVPSKRRYFKCSKQCVDEINHIEILCQVFITTSEFVFSQIEAYKGDDVNFFWQGTHNIQETKY